MINRRDCVAEAKYWQNRLRRDSSDALALEVCVFLYDQLDVGKAEPDQDRAYPDVYAAAREAHIRPGADAWEAPSWHEQDYVPSVEEILAVNWEDEA